MNAGRIPRYVLLGLALLSVSAATASESYGPIVWSRDQDAVFSAHDGRVSRLTLGDPEPHALTPAIPEPHAIAVDEESGRLVVSWPSPNGQAAVYDMADTAALYCLAGLPGFVLDVHTWKGEVRLAGHQFIDRRSLDDGMRIDLAEWDTPKRISDVLFEGEKAVLLHRNFLFSGDSPESKTRLALQEGESALAFYPGRRGRVILIQRGSQFLLRLPGDDDRLIMETGEREALLGAAYSEKAGQIALVIDAPGVTDKDGSSRVELRDAEDGEMIKRFRSAQIRSGVKRYETPIAVSYHPNGRLLVISWRLTGTQAWDIVEWKLDTNWQ